MKRIAFYSAIAGLVLALLLVVSFRGKGNKHLTSKGGVTRSELVKKCVKAKSPGREFDMQNAFIEIADQVGEAVVAISTERTQKMNHGSSNSRFKRFGSGGSFGEEDPLERFFYEFFGQMPEKEFKQKGLGTGVIIDKEGHILTNHHVIEDADQITINLPDGRTFQGVVKGSDPRSDLAVVKIDAKDLPYAELGDSDLLKVGGWVVAMGNPFGYILRSPKPTVTVGVVSALHRRIPTPGPSGDRGYLDMIQTDAAINPGNSGGPLCDLNGKVIGINVVIFSTSGGYQGIGFAIPINSVKEVLGDLISGKEIAYGWLGVTVQEIDKEMAEYFKLKDEKGALVSQVTADSPAEAGGINEGDIIISINGQKINEVHDLLKEVSKAKEGKIVNMDVLRDGSKRILKVTIGKRPAKIEGLGEEDEESYKETKEWRGIKVTSITDGIAQDLELKNKEGVVIVTIDTSSRSFDAGLMRGDVIREINRVKILDVDGYLKATKEAKGPALIRTDRGYFIVKPE